MKVFKEEKLPQHKNDFDLRCKIKTSVRKTESEKIIMKLKDIEGVVIKIIK